MHKRVLRIRFSRAEGIQTSREEGWSPEGVLNQCFYLPSVGGRFPVHKAPTPDASTQCHSGDAPSNPSCWLFSDWVFLPSNKLHRQGDGCDVTIGSTLLIGTRKKKVSQEHYLHLAVKLDRLGSDGRLRRTRQLHWELQVSGLGTQATL